MFLLFPSSKIQQYSPTDSSKAYERQVNRRTNVRFNPKATMDIIAKGSPPEILSDEEKKELVHNYLQVLHRLTFFFCVQF